MNKQSLLTSELLDLFARNGLRTFDRQDLQLIRSGNLSIRACKDLGGIPATITFALNDQRWDVEITAA